MKNEVISGIEKLKARLVGKRIVDVKVHGCPQLCSEKDVRVNEYGVHCCDVTLILDDGTKLVFECSEWGFLWVKD